MGSRAIAIRTFPKCSDLSVDFFFRYPSFMPAICVTSNDGGRDSGKGSSMDTDNNMDSTGTCNNMVQDGVADGIPYRLLYLEKK